MWWPNQHVFLRIDCTKGLSAATNSLMLHELKSIYPKERLLDSEGAKIPFQSDGLTAFVEKPRAIVIPEKESEIVSTIQWCQKHRVPFVARGSGTSLSGGSLPCADGIVIALNRMNRIIDLNPVERTARVQPGAINLHVTQAAQEHGLYYAPDPSSQQVCTIGGNVAFNSGGAHCLKYGMTSNHVLGLRLVLPEGDVVEIGSNSLESVGPDAVGLFVGSEGLFGIATEITLRLLPIQKAVHTITAGYENVEQAGHAVSSVIESGLLPAAMEIMDYWAIQAAMTAVDAKYPADANAILIVELDGSEEGIRVEKEKLNALISATKPIDVTVAESTEQRAEIWKGRKSAFSAVGRVSPDFIVQDSVVPRTKLGEALGEIERMAARVELRVANVFHAGDGNLHPLILYDGRVDGELLKAEALASEIVEMCVRLGGSITGEHGVGMEKRHLMPRMFTPDDLAAMESIRNAIDPHEISNRGKMFPGSEPSSLGQAGLHPLERAGVISRE